jgi:predicted protein tyrosine phosphatase
MEKKHLRRLRDKFGPMLKDDKKVICLDIPDEFTFMDDELIEILRSRVSEHIELP